MADLLVEAPSFSSFRLKSILHPLSTRQDAKPDRLRTSKSLSQLPQVKAPEGLVLRTVKGVNDLWQGWRDGLTVAQREEQRLRESRRQILCLRLKNVRREIVTRQQRVLLTRGRPSRMNNGRPQPRNLTPSRATTSGKSTRLLAIIIPISLQGVSPSLIMPGRVATSDR